MDHDGDCVFDIEISTPDLKVHSYFWGDVDSFSEFGAGLRGFPRRIDDMVVFETGEESIGLGYPYLLLTAACYDHFGHSALQIVVNNNELLPRAQRLEFFIPAEVASINALGNLLSNWKCDVDSEVLWEAQTS
ncbi:hypothetical protein [Hymenobacter koreensis]|uniref:Uncharacterized protein n=1 Tax=Hymenobacter koreensis TaxID=1084523 RepID=A0ABP8IWF2_9BACT